MKICIIGYMGSGKSHISKILAKKLDYKLIDLDKEIISKNGMSISEIFSLKGEIYFRKEERSILEKILSDSENCIISLGGGTPAYYDNINLINKNSQSIYLKTSIPNLTQRLLKQKQKRPLIAKIPDEDLPEFIAKHLFERVYYYEQAEYKVTTDNKNPDEIVEEIINLLPLANQDQPR